MCDLDHFKKINDRYGHAAGDAVLRGFADILKKNTRASNMCARLGGEEFLLILSHAQKENAEIAIERIRKMLEQMEFSFSGENARVTASFGAAGFNPSHPVDFDKLASEADKALYLAKQKGRNRIEFSDAPPPRFNVVSGGSSAL